jgi:uncharacterized protein
LKNGVRYIAIASGPIEKGTNALIVGVIFRDNYIEGVLSTKIKIDGTDSTERIIKMIKNSRFKDQIRILLFNGIALAGLNILDIRNLEKELGSKVVLLNKRKQNAAELIKALNEFSQLKKSDVKERINFVKESKNLNSVKVDNLFLQSKLEKPYLRNFAKNAFEALRIAHIFARGVATGESKGHL